MINELLCILTDLYTGALPLSELPHFIVWQLKGHRP